MKDEEVKQVLKEFQDMMDELPKISKKVKDRLTRVRTALILDQPFFGTLCIKLRFIESLAFPTAATDGIRIFYNPFFMDSLSADEMKMVLAHEVMHCACDHSGRLGNRHIKKWNVATDYAINLILKDAGFALPSDVLYDECWRKMDAEEIYSKLPENGSGKGKGKGVIIGFPGDGYGDGSEKYSDVDPGKCGGVIEPSDENGRPLSDAEKQEITEDWKISVAQAAQQAKSIGKLPGSLERFVEEVLEPKIDWREVLRRFVNWFARNDYRWLPPNRRYLANNLYLPSLKGEELPPIVIGVDVSGSISQEELSQFAGELNGICSQYPISRLYVVYCDAAIQGEVEEYSQYDIPIQLHTCGGGGTDFRPVFDWAEENNIEVGCMIYLTDCAGYFPDYAPDYPVLWVKIGDYTMDIPFGEVCQI
jgi:predicted metal-dependent peptidase